MRPKLPSPAMVVALVALVVALSGTAIAAVTYARNAGAVDGHSAVSARASLSAAAGNLVATKRGGAGKGRIPARFVEGVMRGASTTLTRYLPVTDNADGPVVALAVIPDVGRIDAQCRDQDPAEGRESSRTIMTFTAKHAPGVNVTRLLALDIDAGRDPVVFSVVPDQTLTIMDPGEPLFQLVLQAGTRTVFVAGGTRPDTNDSPSAACLIFGLALRAGG